MTRAKGSNPSERRQRSEPGSPSLPNAECSVQHSPACAAEGPMQIRTILQTGINKWQFHTYLYTDAP